MLKILLLFLQLLLSGDLTTVTDVQGNITSYTFDEAGNKLTQTDAESRTTACDYGSAITITNYADYGSGR